MITPTSSAKQRRRRLKGWVKSTKQKGSGSIRCNGSPSRRVDLIGEKKICWWCTYKSRAARTESAVTSSCIRHDGCLLFHSCNMLCSTSLTVIHQAEGWIYQVNRKCWWCTDDGWVVRAERAVTSSCVNHDGCLLSYSYSRPACTTSSTIH